jgi:hypothetical protein
MAGVPHRPAAPRRWAAAALAASLCLLAAGCGGGGGGASKVEAAKYANDVCGAVETWQQQLTSASTLLAQRTSETDDLKQVRTQFVSFFNGAIKTTDEMLAAVDAAGVPDLDKGEKLSAALRAELAKFRPILVEARDKAKRLPVHDESLFASQAQSIGTRFQIEAAGLARLFDVVSEQYDSPELTRAAQESAVCRNL